MGNPALATNQSKFPDIGKPVRLDSSIGAEFSTALMTTMSDVASVLLLPPPPCSPNCTFLGLDVLLILHLMGTLIGGARIPFSLLKWIDLPARRWNGKITAVWYSCNEKAIYHFSSLTKLNHAQSSIRQIPKECNKNKTIPEINNEMKWSQPLSESGGDENKRQVKEFSICIVPYPYPGRVCVQGKVRGVPLGSSPQIKWDP